MKTIVDILPGFVESAMNFSATPSGIEIIVMDPSHVSLLNLLLPKESFSSYRCKKKVNIGVNVLNLNKILKRLNSSESLEIILDSKSNKIYLEAKGKIKNTFSLNLIDLEEEQYPEPKLDITAKIILDTPNILTEAIKNVDLFSDHVDFNVNTKEFIISGKGNNGETATTISKSTEEVTFEVKEKTNSKYPLSYLINILKATSITEQLTIEFSSELPLLLKFKLKDEAEIYLKYSLAPRVEKEEVSEEELEEEEKTEESEEEKENA